MLAATRANTHSSYQTAWASWHDSCSRGDVDPLSASIEDVLKFLTEAFTAGKSFRDGGVTLSKFSIKLCPRFFKIFSIVWWTLQNRSPTNGAATSVGNRN